jgi:hypothetical protein
MGQYYPRLLGTGRYRGYHAIDPDDRYNPGTEAPKRPMLMDPIVYRSGWPEIEEQTPSTTERLTVPPLVAT